MLQTALGKMIHLVILVCIFKHVWANMTTDCDDAGNVTTFLFQRLELAEEMIQQVNHPNTYTDGSRYAEGTTVAKCERNGNAYLKLDIVVELIKAAKEKIPMHCQSPLPMDCQEILENGEKTSGVYLVRPNNRVLSGAISVYCDMDTDGGGWTVIQRRGDFGSKTDYFSQDWKEYKEGFGNLKEDFWLGNDYIYALSNQKQYSIRFDLGDVESNTRYAVYNTFWIEEETNNYTLHVSGYNGNAGDSFSHHNSCPFTTRDRDNDINPSNCAQIYLGGWWYKSCYTALLNGEYLKGKTEKKWQGLVWQDWKGDSESLVKTELKIRRNPSWIN